MRRNPSEPGGRFDLEALRERFDRPEVAAVYVFGSTVTATPHPLSDVDLAYLGVDGDAEERVFDELYEMLQREVGEGGFDLVPLRRAPLHMQFAVATTGERLLVRDRKLMEAFETRAIVRYLDFKPHRDRYYATPG
jgi:predicted nucleotidyltransferase